MSSADLDPYRGDIAARDNLIEALRVDLAEAEIRRIDLERENKELNEDLRRLELVSKALAHDSKSVSLGTHGDGYFQQALSKTREKLFHAERKCRRANRDADLGIAVLCLLLVAQFVQHCFF